MEMTVKEFKEAIRGLGLSQIQASRILGKKTRTIQRWYETGYVKDPAVVVLLKLAYRLMEAPMHLSKPEVCALLHEVSGVPYSVTKQNIEERRTYQIKRMQSIIEELEGTLNK